MATDWAHLIYRVAVTAIASDGYATKAHNEASAALLAHIKALEAERDKAQALNAEWQAKAATWLASPEARKQLEGYRELAARAEKAEAERDALKQQVETLLAANQTLSWKTKGNGDGR